VSHDVQLLKPITDTSKLGLVFL